MDSTKTPVVSWTHIIDENWARICKVLYPGENVKDNAFKEANQYDAQGRLQGALNIALNRVHANYRAAVPHSFNGELQLLLPLCLRQRNRPDLILTVSRIDTVPPVPGSFIYTARTILTLNIPYRNARLVARPEKNWLLAPQNIEEIEAELDDEDDD